jgi:hypothetical protein
MKETLIDRTRSLIPILMAAALLITLAGVALADEETIDGVTHVRNGAEPRDGVEVLSVDELWRVGGADDEENIFGLITRVIADEEGMVYLLDTQLSQVNVFTPDGTFSNTLSREGEGPGECRFPVDMLMMPDGTVGLVQAFPGQIICLDKADNPGEIFKPGGDDPTQGGFLSLVDVQSSGEHLVLGGVMSTINQEEGFQIRDHFIRNYATDGTENFSYLNDPKKYEFAHLDIVEAEQYFPQFRKWVLADDGRIFVAEYREDYRINVYGPDGTLIQVIERESKPWVRTDEQKAYVDGILEAQLRQVPFPVERSVSENDEVIANMELRPDGELWVLTSRGFRAPPEGMHSVYDVFDADGVYVRQMQMPIEGDGLQDGVIFAGDDRLMLVKGFTDALISLQTQGSGPTLSEDEEPAPMEVICYAIK